MNKKAGIGTEWVFALTTLFGLTVMVITMNMVFHEHLAPKIIDSLPNDDVGHDAESGINFYLYIWDFLPYIIGFMVAAFVVIISIKKEPTERY